MFMGAGRSDATITERSRIGDCHLAQRFSTPVSFPSASRIVRDSPPAGSRGRIQRKHACSASGLSFCRAPSCSPSLRTPALPSAAGRGLGREEQYLHQHALDVQLKHAPEQGSQEGIATFDTQISTPTLVDDLDQRRELKAALAKIDTMARQETDRNVQEDIEILRKAFDLQFRTEDYA
jgi:hypothetical protein